MKKYILFSFAFLLLSLGLFSNAGFAKAANCAPGDLFNTSNGESCDTRPPTVCSPGDLYNTSNGMRCPTAQDGTSQSSTVVNFIDGQQVRRLDVNGKEIDAHDGGIYQFNGKYYLYGTSYGCGWKWGDLTSTNHFCGFKSYSSTDLVHWVDNGFLFDATGDVWQERCVKGPWSGCFRPHVIFNATTGKYVLWVNAPSGTLSGYRVFLSSAPEGPFVETSVPTLTIKNTDPNYVVNGDMNLFVDDDGTAYVIYAYWANDPPNFTSMYIEKLDSSYTSGTGQYTYFKDSFATEAPSMFKRGGNYYIVYGPACGYCTGIKTMYRTASSPLGQWVVGTNGTNGDLNPNSCGGQPTHVTPIVANNAKAYLFESDLWKNTPNEFLANYYWAPLSFNADNSIQPFACVDSFNLAPTLSMSPTSYTTPSSAGSMTSAFAVTSNVSWTVASNQTWVTLNKTSGTGNQTVGFSYTANTSNAARTAIITITAENRTATYTFTQNGTTTNPSPSVSFTVNGQHNLAVPTGTLINYSWTIANADVITSYVTTNNQDGCGSAYPGQSQWLGTIPTSGTNSGTISQCQAGTTYTITIKATNSSTGVSVTDQVVEAVSGTSTSKTADIKANGSDGPIYSRYRNTANITWTSSGYSNCSVSPALNGISSGLNNANGTPTFALTASLSNTFNLICDDQVRDSVVVNIPPEPTNPQVSCGADGTSATLKWTSVAGWNHHYVRISLPDYTQQMIVGIPSGNTEDYVCSGNCSFTYTNLTPGKIYAWWVHARDPIDNNIYSQGVPVTPPDTSRQFSCSAGGVLGAEAFHFTNWLALGSYGNEITELQKFLNATGYDIGVADGNFGAKTEAAVIKLQTANKLKADGIVGALTRAVLNK